LGILDRLPCVAFLDGQPNAEVTLANLATECEVVSMLD
jgi:hypothetical protein